MKKILIATDFSESCDNAMEYLTQLVAGTDISIDLIHSYHLPFVSTMKDLEVDVRREMEVTHKYYKAKLNARLKELDPANRGKTHLVYGLFPSSDLATKVAKINPDLVVLAMRKNYNKIDKIIGTVTAHTIEKTAVPILAIPFGAKFQGWQKTIMLSESQKPYQIEERMDMLTEWLSKFSSSDNPTEVDVVHVKKTKEQNLEISYPNQPVDGVTFRITNSPSVEQGIEAMTEHNAYNMMIVARSRSNILRRVFNSSKTTKWLYNSKLPVLVL